MQPYIVIGIILLLLVGMSIIALALERHPARVSALADSESPVGARESEGQASASGNRVGTSEGRGAGKPDVHAFSKRAAATKKAAVKKKVSTNKKRSGKKKAASKKKASNTSRNTE